MRHPFDGINQPHRESRRTWLGLLAGLVGAVAVRAAAPPVRVAKPDPSPEPPVATTKAIGEEGAAVKPPRATTLAVGEEGGPGRPPVLTTKALGEEGAATRALREAGGPAVTTLAVGEEGGKKK